MNRLSLILIVPVLALAACTGGGEGEERRGPINTALDEARAEIREEFATKNMTLGRGAKGEPRAEISPQGDLLIGGEAVPLDAAQRELVLAYRTELVAVAETGANLGLDGASLATDAVGAALKAAARGEDPAKIEAEIQAKAAGMKASAKALCDRLPALHASQQALAEAVPAFAPYAGMDEQDVADCKIEP
ncbi:hypothetical protein [Arenimonas sp.]|uniref:hypothetical protein n=1 Tax=Arenimonas sp. TaxID=1872635 RepID=UPI0025F9130C|nr:hypothetical protein [Arenimonas sp.]